GAPLLARRALHYGKRRLGLGPILIVAEVADEISLARTVEQIAFWRFRNQVIGFNPRSLNRVAVRRVVARRRQLDRGVATDGQYDLHRTFAERAGSQNLRAIVVL